MAHATSAAAERHATQPPGPAGKDSQLRRGLNALELLARRPATASQIARELDVNRSTALRILQELENAGYVARETRGTRYAIVAQRLYELASADGAVTDISDVIHPFLAELRDEYEEATAFAVPARGKMIYLVCFPSPHPVSVREQIGTARPAHASALGKAWLAALPEPAREQEIEQLEYVGGSNLAASNAAQLRSKLTEVLDQGYAVDREETFEGVTCVAAPVVVGDALVGAVGITGPSQRFSPQRIATLGEALRQRTAELSRGGR